MITVFSSLKSDLCRSLLYIISSGYSHFFDVVLMQTQMQFQLLIV